MADKPMTPTEKISALREILAKIGNEYELLAYTSAGLNDGSSVRYALKAGEIKQALTATEGGDGCLTATEVMLEARRKALPFDTMVNALSECAQQFRVYEQLHRAKPDHAKADTNADYAIRCENALQVAGFDIAWEDGRLYLYNRLLNNPPKPEKEVK